MTDDWIVLFGRPGRISRDNTGMCLIHCDRMSRRTSGEILNIGFYLIPTTMHFNTNRYTTSRTPRSKWTHHQYQEPSIRWKTIQKPGAPGRGLNEMLTTLLCYCYEIRRSTNAWNLAEYSKECYSSKRVVLAMLMMVQQKLYGWTGLE
jgi:hypothetical protein